jgi:hypothetical protein
MPNLNILLLILIEMGSEMGSSLPLTLIRM